MIGKLLSIADKDGQVYVENAREQWLRRGFEIVDKSFDGALNIKDFSQYFLIAITMRQCDLGLYRSKTKMLRSLTNTPIIVFPCGSPQLDEAKAYLLECVDQVIYLPTDMEWAIANCLALIRRYTELNRQEPPKLTMLYIDYKIFLDVGRYSVHVDGKEIELSNLEFGILKYLLEHRGYIMSYAQIYRAVWGEEYADNSNNVLWAHIKNLRDKIQWHSSLPQYIRTKIGIGYSFSPHYDSKKKR